MRGPGRFFPNRQPPTSNLLDKGYAMSKFNLTMLCCTIVAVALSIGAFIMGAVACSRTQKLQAAMSAYLVRRVIDGDTIEIVDAGGIRTRVRFRRIDAPELDEVGGPEAKAALEKRMLGKRVRVTPHARDRYGRLIADVVVAGQTPIAQ